MKTIQRLLKGDRLALARVLSVIEDRDEKLREIIEELHPHTGHAFVLGITGPPGAGKSTVTDKLIKEIRTAKQSVAVVAIDPSSPFSGGAILGDRIRMMDHYKDQGVFIRSLGTRGKHGGLSQSTREVVMALDAAGFDWIIVETVGVGQNELDVLKLAHGVCVVVVPESGDGVQVMKAGLMEIADIFVVNKADRPESDKLVRELVTMVGMNSASWSPPVLKTQATIGNGIEELFAEIERFKEFAKTHGVLEKKRQKFIEEEISEIILNNISRSINDLFSASQVRKRINAVIKGDESPFKAADFIQSRLLK